MGRSKLFWTLARGLVETWVYAARYAEAPMRCSSRWVNGLLLSFILASAASAQLAAGPQPNLTLSGTFEGSRVAVFDTKKDSCELIDIPDAPARAFVDYQGTVHLVSSHYVMRASLGPTLETVKHNCQIAYNSHHDPNPADFDDSTWL